MFDIGFWELTTIAVIALLVIGPDKLPGVARQAGKWVGRARRFVGDVKSDIDRELKQEEIRKAIADDVGLDEIKEIMNTDDFRIDADETPDYQVKAIPDSSDDFEKDEDDYDSQLDEKDMDEFFAEDVKEEKIQSEPVQEKPDNTATNEQAATKKS